MTTCEERQYGRKCARINANNTPPSFAFIRVHSRLNRFFILFLLTALSALLPAQEPAAYPPSKHGGNYMYSYYFPPSPSTTPWAPCWSPDGKWIAAGMDGSIWKIDPGNGVAFELTYNRKYHSSPDWSPDGKWIVYTADDGGKTIQLEIANTETGESHPLTNDRQIYTDPSFSPDGTRLVYISTNPNGYFNVFVRPIRNGQWAGEEIAVSRDHSYGSDRLYFGEWDMHTQPRWTPDGMELVLVSNRSVKYGSGAVMRVPAERDGISKSTPILTEQTMYRTHPDVSIDGKRIVYSSSGGATDEYNHLYVLPVKGGEPYKLTFGSFDDFHPRWSPDGEWIAYISNDGGLPQLWLLETYGGEKKQILIQSRRWKRPMGQAHVRVIDERTGALTAARMYAPASDGKTYAPHGAFARIGAVRMVHRSGEPIFHTQGEFAIEVPPGAMTIEAVKGFEYAPVRADVAVKAGQIAELTIVLKPMVAMASKGWYGGATHTHMNYGGNLHNTLENVLAMGRAEGLDVICPLVANKDNRILDWEHFVQGGGEHPVSTKDIKVIVGEEYRPPFWGHVFLIGLRDHLISPFLTGYEGTAIESLYPSNTDMFRKAKAQGAITGYVHPFGGNGDPLNAGLGGAKAFPVDLALGAVDTIDSSGSNHAALVVLSHALNNDFPVAISAGEDSSTSLQLHTLLGSIRTYAYVGPQLTARAWMDSVAKGRSFTSDGPLVEFSVGNRLPGESIHLPASGGTLDIEARIWSADPLTQVAIYRNGKIWKEYPPSGEIHDRVAVTDSGWFLFTVEGKPAASPTDRSYPQAVTNAIRVYVGDRKIRNRESAEYFIRWIDKLRKMAEADPGWRSQKEREHVMSQLDQARRVYQQRAEEAEL